jgi:hypothetical protein
VPLAQLLFAELAEHAKQNPVPMVQAPRPVASTGARSSPVHGSERAEVASAAPVRAGTLPAARRDSDKRWRERIFDAQQ